MVSTFFFPIVAFFMIHLPLVASLAVAAPDAATCSLDLGLSAEAPLAAGVQGVVELPGRVRVAAGLGGVPGAFVSGASGIATATGLLEDSAAQALHDSLHGTRVLGASVGGGLWSVRASGWQPTTASSG